MTTQKSERRREILAEQKIMKSAPTSGMLPTEKIQFHLDYMELVYELEEIDLALADDAIAQKLHQDDMEQDALDHQEWLDLIRHHDWEEERVRY